MRCIFKMCGDGFTIATNLNDATGTACGPGADGRSGHEERLG
jgi:hypothetical protein